jgi:hypothetical protein
MGREVFESVFYEDLELLLRLKGWNSPCLILSSLTKSLFKQVIVGPKLALENFQQAIRPPSSTWRWLADSGGL